MDPARSGSSGPTTRKIRYNRRMRFESLSYASLLTMGLIASCTNEPGTTTLFDPTHATGDSDTTDDGADDTGTADAADTSDDDTEGGTTADAEASTDDGASTPSGAVCGDGIISANEECDCGGDPCTPEGLGNTSCVDVDDPSKPGLLTGGTLGCNPASCRFDTSQCTYCGDGEINGIEQCEPGLPIDLTCEALGRGTGGLLGCDEQTCMADTSACTDCGYLFDFASCAGWTTGKAHNLAADPSWECGNPTGGPPENLTGVWATNLSGNYQDDESGFLRSPPLDLSQCAGEGITMTLRHWYHFEGGAGNRDGGIVQISTNGTNWTTIAPTGGAVYGNAITASYAPVHGSQGFGNLGNNAQTMLESQWDLSAYSGLDEVHLRFVFGSDGSVARSGWYLDHLELLGTGS
jgi:hypothetical protein